MLSNSRAILLSDSLTGTLPHDTFSGMKEILTKINHISLIPVVALDRAADAPELAAALLEGGLPCAEVTFRTPAAEESIRVMARQFPGLLIGAGTVLTIEQAERAVQAGAQFLVSPGFDEELAEWCIQQHVLFIPGVMTPSEIIRALRKGISTLKFFPAEAAGGVPMIKSLAGPFNQVKFVATGGITAANLAGYLKLPSVTACGGSWMVQKELIAGGDFNKIRSLCKQAMDLIKTIKGN